jgi:hypothetical protein
MPALQLKEEQPFADAVSAPVSTAISLSSEISSAPLSPALEKFETWLVQSWVTAPREHAESGGFGHWVGARIFPEPAVIRLKRVAIGGSLLNAVKLRNPFCLLNPVVFFVEF